MEKLYTVRQIKTENDPVLTPAWTGLFRAGHRWAVINKENNQLMHLNREEQPARDYADRLQRMRERDNGLGYGKRVASLS